KNAAKVGVTFEDDAVKIEGFALVPVHSWPDIDQGGQHRKFVVFDIAPYAQSCVVGDGQQVQNHCKPTRMRIIFCRQCGSTPSGVIDATEVNGDIEAQFGV